MGHHAAKLPAGMAVIRHNRLRDVFLSFCHQAHQLARLEAGSGLTAGFGRPICDNNNHNNWNYV